MNGSGRARFLLPEGVMSRTLALGLFCIGALVACQRPSPPLTPASGTLVTDDANAPLTDLQIASVAVAAHSSELQQAKIALRRATRKDVREFAKAVLAHHEKALHEVHAIGSRLGAAPEPSASASDLRSSNTELVLQLNVVERADFDRDFIVSQIGNHEELLALIDARLLPDARNPELRSALEALRPTAALHLARAIELQRALE